MATRMDYSCPSYWEKSNNHDVIFSGKVLALYTERVEHFFEFNADRITDESKRESMFLSAIGSEAYTFIRMLIGGFSDISR